MPTTSERFDMILQVSAFLVRYRHEPELLVHTAAALVGSVMADKDEAERAEVLAELDRAIAAAVKVMEREPELAET